jgi:hypothetical protein
MNDVFLSYARVDRVQAERLVLALRGNGWSVWWDKDIRPGTEYSRAIRDELSAAKCVIVLWSRAAVQSDWVPSEAEDARARGILLPVIVEGVRLPVPFNVLQCVDLSNWSGSLSDLTFQALLEAVRQMATAASGARSSAPGGTHSPDAVHHLPDGIPPNRGVHGLSGRWNVKAVFSRWRNRDIKPGESVVFHGSASLFLDAGGERGTGIQTGVLIARLEGGYTEMRYIGNQIVDARWERDGTLRLTIQISHRPLVEPVKGTPPPEFGEDLLANLLTAPPFHLTLRHAADKPKALEGEHDFTPGVIPYQLATEQWSYFEL